MGATAVVEDVGCDPHPTRIDKSATTAPERMSDRLAVARARSRDSRRYTVMVVKSAVLLTHHGPARAVVTKDDRGHERDHERGDHKKRDDPPRDFQARSTEKPQRRLHEPLRLASGWLVIPSGSGWVNPLSHPRPGATFRGAVTTFDVGVTLALQVTQARSRPPKQRDQPDRSGSADHVEPQRRVLQHLHDRSQHREAATPAAPCGIAAAHRWLVGQGCSWSHSSTRFLPSPKVLWQSGSFRSGSPLAARSQ